MSHSNFTKLAVFVDYSGRFVVHGIFKVFSFSYAQPAVTCLKLIIETIEQGVKYIQS